MGSLGAPPGIVGCGATMGIPLGILGTTGPEGGYCPIGKLPMFIERRATLGGVGI
jgi:hypothetical protein